MLQQDAPQDYVIATGETHSVREFVERAFGEAGISVEWSGSGVDEKGRNAATGEILVEVDPAYFRPTEVELLLGDPTKAKRDLGWEPKVTFPTLVRRMVRSDLDLFRKEKLCSEAGYEVGPALEDC